MTTPTTGATAAAKPAHSIRRRRTRRRRRRARARDVVPLIGDLLRVPLHAAMVVDDDVPGGLDEIRPQARVALRCCDRLLRGRPDPVPPRARCGDRRGEPAASAPPGPARQGRRARPRGRAEGAVGADHGHPEAHDGGRRVDPHPAPDKGLRRPPFQPPRTHSGASRGRTSSSPRRSANSTKLLDELLAATAPALITRMVIGTGHAAQLLITAGQNFDRLHSTGKRTPPCTGADIAPAVAAGDAGGGSLIWRDRGCRACSCGPTARRRWRVWRCCRGEELGVAELGGHPLRWSRDVPGGCGARVVRRQVTTHVR